MLYYKIRAGAVTAYQNWEMIWTDFHNTDVMVFSKDEIVDENDGVLKVRKSFYPKDDKHYFYVFETDIQEWKVK